MKRFLVAGIAAAALCGAPALAADIATRAPIYKAPVAVAAYNWTGFYVGGNAGGAWSTGNANYTVDPFFALAPVGGPAGDAGRAALAAAHTHLSDTGFTGGVQAGYNWQLNNIVLGVEVDFNALSLNNSADTIGLSGTAVPWVNNVHTSIKTDWLLTVRPRLGWASDRVLIYATGGLALTHLKTFQSQSNNDVFGGGFFAGYSESVSDSKTKAGWIVGAGLEYALSDHWTVKGEYLYADFGSVTSTGIAGPPTTFAFGGQTFTHTFDLRVNIVRAGLNYKF